MYPVHHPTLKIEQAQRQADAALLRLAATAGGTRRRWWSRRPRPATVPGGAVPATAPVPAPVPVPGGSVAAGDDRVLVGR